MISSMSKKKKKVEAKKATLDVVSAPTKQATPSF